MNLRWMLACLALLLMPVTAQAENTLTPEEISAGWISLFDGETLFGWQAQSKADWKVEAGTISVSAGEPGLLTTTSSFVDYTLQLEFQAEALRMLRPRLGAERALIGFVGGPFTLYAYAGQRRLYALAATAGAAADLVARCQNKPRRRSGSNRPIRAGAAAGCLFRSAPYRC